MLGTHNRAFRTATAAAVLVLGLFWFWLMTYAMSLAGPPLWTEPTPPGRELTRTAAEGPALTPETDASPLPPQAPERVR